MTVATEEERELSASELAACIAALKKLRPKDLEKPELTELRTVGAALFKSQVLKEKFGSEDVVGALKQKWKVEKKVQALEKLTKEVSKEHEQRKEKAQTCGMNLARKAQLEKIKAECAAPAMAALPAVPLAPALADAATGEAEMAAEEVAEPADEDSQVCQPGAAPTRRQERREVAGLPPKDDFYYRCNMCRGEYLEAHHFYHQLCPRCAELNWEKRQQTADMKGMVCIVTGGRVRIGYEIVLKLLRAGAFVLTTSRFPHDCALRYSREADFEAFKDRLEVVGPVELSDMRLVERFADELLQRFPRIHVLINNAAQTLTRPEGWTTRMIDLERAADDKLTPDARNLLRLPSGPGFRAPLALQLDAAEPIKTADVPEASTKDEQVSKRSEEPAETAAADVEEQEEMWREALQLADFPAGQLDESRQPLDLSRINSWSRRLGDIPTLELLQTLAANTAAPFILCSRLADALAPPTEKDPYGHIVNVSALEGKFSVKRKSNAHPHTNMAKAALNMLTLTSSSDMFQRRVLMNCVDTGWVTDMAPGGVGVVAATHATYVAPPLDEEDGAARVLDPVFQHLNDQMWLIRGKFFKNYFVAQW
eukprot:TRINITY_DN113347_c0_g1_i1.p1 TRINITY_DN113347_c0_g1~~TRINITY_DN113347_c0_g1_i1.p1  ORF type:complete len:596 (+),score=187.48 TRINITY_DN113347_c0_g1_i1:121-1908(+)